MKNYAIVRLQISAHSVERATKQSTADRGNSKLGSQSAIMPLRPNMYS
jgi:hypothetical protein